MRSFFVYIVTNKPRGVLYTGVTNNILRRSFEHKFKINKGFTSRYNLNKLVWFEEHQNVYEAISREKQIKGWIRKRKITLIESMNPSWEDLYDYVLRNFHGHS